eukprot:scaffold10223_cov57-Attheya_sp.AAC.1
MGNTNGQFDASTVAVYTRLDLIKWHTYDSKKTAAEVLATRSAKALSLVRSSFGKKFDTKQATPSDELLHVMTSRSDPPCTPATPSPDKQGCDDPPSMFEAYKSVTTQSLCQMLPHEIVGLSDGDLITLVVTVNTHKFNLIQDAVGSDHLSNHSFSREAETMYEFPVLLHYIQDRDGISNGIFSDSELKRKFGSQDILSGSIEIYQSPASNYEHPDFFDIAGHSRDPTNYASYYTSLLDMTHGGQGQTQHVLVSYYRQKNETLQRQIEGTNSKLHST